MYLLQCIRYEVDLIGGNTRSIFKNTERYLQEDNHLKALKVFSRNKSTDKYHSYMDFFFCEAFPHLKSNCFRYYNDEGPALRDMIKKISLVKYDLYLLRIAKHAYNIYEKEQKRSWGWGKFLNSIQND